MRKILAVVAVLALSLGISGTASADELETIGVTKGPWTCTVVFVDNNANGYPDFGDVIVSARCTWTIPQP